MKIRTKKDFYQRWNLGLFGNKLRNWSSADEVLEDAYDGPVGMRYKKGGGGYVAYDVPQNRILDVMKEWVRVGAESDLIYFGEMAPDDLLVMQGELCLNPSYVMLYSTKKHVQMRDALRDSGQHADGIRAKILLESAMTPPSYSDMQALLELYPDSTIEFGIYEVCLGDIPGRNTIIWEVRDY